MQRLGPFILLAIAVAVGVALAPYIGGLLAIGLLIALAVVAIRSPGGRAFCVALALGWGVWSIFSRPDSAVAWITRFVVLVAGVQFIVSIIGPLLGAALRRVDRYFAQR